MFLHLNPFLYARFIKWGAQKTMSFPVGHAMFQRILGLPSQFQEPLGFHHTEAPLRSGIARFAPCRQVWGGKICRKPTPKNVKYRDALRFAQTFLARKSRQMEVSMGNSYFLDRFRKSHPVSNRFFPAHFYEEPLVLWEGRGKEPPTWKIRSRH